MLTSLENIKLISIGTWFFLAPFLMPYHKIPNIKRKSWDKMRAITPISLDFNIPKNSLIPEPLHEMARDLPNLPPVVFLLYKPQKITPFSPWKINPTATARYPTTLLPPTLVAQDTDPPAIPHLYLGTLTWFQHIPSFTPAGTPYTNTDRYPTTHPLTTLS